jgi:hypothetical protein
MAIINIIYIFVILYFVYNLKMSNTNNLQNLINIYCPYLYFSKKEVCFPITIEKYLSVCELQEKEKTIINNVEPKDLYEIGIQNNFQFNDQYALNFKDPNWKENISGSSSDASCYCLVRENNNQYIFIYFYLLAYTIPYKLFNCACSLNSYAHKSDLKFNAVYVNKDTLEIDGVYFGAHGSHAGEYVVRDSLDFLDGHPVSYSSYGDHSNYSKPECYPRIYFSVYDKCSKDILVKPEINIIYEKDNPNFDVNTMGWIYFPGFMNSDGISAPIFNYFLAKPIPIKDSNNWYRRLFCSKYF